MSYDIYRAVSNKVLAPQDNRCSDPGQAAMRTHFPETGGGQFTHFQKTGPDTISWGPAK